MHIASTLSAPPLQARPPRGGIQRVGILSTFPPTPCGLATFSAALARGIESHGAQAHIVRILDGPSRPTPVAEGGLVVGDLRPGSPSSAAAAARLLNDCDMAVVQHEYGMFGGEDGDDVLAVLADLRVPTVVVAHTVLLTPTSHQRAVLVQAAQLADQVVVMSQAARDRLCDVFAVNPAKVTIIPHGAALASAGPPPVVDRSTMLTWGLVGPGKGIERVIDVMPHLRRRNPTARYVIAGRTHPKVLAAQGEEYRSALATQALRLGVADAVEFDPTYRDVASLGALIRSCGVVVLPYDSTDQVTSGVLVDAVAAGRPVVATAFPHAVELLASGAGIVVPHNDPDALELALARVLTRPRVAARMAAEAAKLAPAMGWPVVGRSYLALAGRLSGQRPALV